jgi:tryptophan 2,3-dioxygenase
MTLTYATYLKLDELLDLQVPQSDPAEHDETLFIIIHQTYELWFKQLIHELEKVRRDFSEGELWGAVHTLKRARMIVKTLVGQVDILETMTPMSFASFRDRLDTASGFQSVQFREVESILGHRQASILRHHPEGSPARELLERRLAERSLYDHFYDFLDKQGAEIPQELRVRDVRASNAAHPGVQDALLRLYKTRPECVVLFELMTDLDEGLQEWRYRHVKMVERTIGARTGTGGSSGVEFLKETLFKPVFPDLWAIRDRL